MSLFFILRSLSREGTLTFAESVVGRVCVCVFFLIVLVPFYNSLIIRQVYKKKPWKNFRLKETFIARLGPRCDSMRQISKISLLFKVTRVQSLRVNSKNYSSTIVGL